MKRRKVGNLLGLTLLVTLTERPMYPYELAATLRERGKDQSIKINWGSLYTVIQNLDKHGFIEAVETTREGGQPQRTVYRITEAGQAEMNDWLRELLGTPEREYPRFEAGLADAGVLGPDAVIELLEQRLRLLDSDIADQRTALQGYLQTLPRLFVIEAEYHLAMCEAEAAWARGLLREMTDGTLPGIEEWRRYHQTGQTPPDFTGMLEADQG